MISFTLAIEFSLVKGKRSASDLFNPIGQLNALTRLMRFFPGYCAALRDRQLMPTALKVAAVVGTILSVINHGSALVQGVTRSRLLSGLLTYLVPYAVNIHGQYISRLRQR